MVPSAVERLERSVVVDVAGGLHVHDRVAAVTEHVVLLDLHGAIGIRATDV